jgi:hypothetical protein
VALFIALDISPSQDRFAAFRDHSLVALEYELVPAKDFS